MLCSLSRRRRNADLPHAAFAICCTQTQNSREVKRWRAIRIDQTTTICWNANLGVTTLCVAVVVLSTTCAPMLTITIIINWNESLSCVNVLQSNFYFLGQFVQICSKCEHVDLFIYFDFFSLFFFLHRMSVTIKIRSRLSSVGDSAPPSETSDGSTSETFEHGSADWHQTAVADHHNHNHLHHHTAQIMTNDSIYTGSSDDAHMLSPDLGGAINDNERVQVESFFSGLGTEVSVSGKKTNK